MRELAGRGPSTYGTPMLSGGGCSIKAEAHPLLDQAANWPKISDDGHHAELQELLAPRLSETTPRWLTTAAVAI